MTREEHIIYAKNLRTALNMANNFSAETMESLDVAIKALEQEPALDRVRAEIDKARFIDKDTKICKNALASGLEVAMEIIDKYKGEVEPQESEDKK